MYPIIQRKLFFILFLSFSTTDDEPLPKCRGIYNIFNIFTKFDRKRITLFMIRVYISVTAWILHPLNGFWQTIHFKYISKCRIFNYKNLKITLQKGCRSRLLYNQMYSRKNRKMLLTLEGMGRTIAPIHSNQNFPS